MSLELSKSPDELKSSFYTLETREDIAKLLEIDDLRLRYHLYIVDRSTQYINFTIPKKNGGERIITAPVTSIKIIQKKLNQVFQSIYSIKPSAHGFVRSKSIRTNSRNHTRRKFVLNIDLKDFFPSINFGRVRGLFNSKPYNRNNEVSTVLAQICCFNNQLPQGAPTSPVISNMICSRLDAKLQQLAKKHNCTYSRYADDISISTSNNVFPKALAYVNEKGKTEVGKELFECIEDNHFVINMDKVRLQTKYRRQEVTGITVNKFPNVKRSYINEIRGILHAWDKYGLESLQSRYNSLYNKKHRNPNSQPPSIIKVVKGKIDYVGMIRGKDNQIYIKLRDKLWSLAPELKKSRQTVLIDESVEKGPLIITEGKTDWKHLKNALIKLQSEGIFTNLNLIFLEKDFPENMGNDNLVKRCTLLSTVSQQYPTICIGDRDVKKVNIDLSEKGKDYKDWGNNVYSFVIPVPSHRKLTPDISIEYYYSDADIIIKDLLGKRLFLNTEFNPQSCRHKVENLSCIHKNKLNPMKLNIIDCDVYNSNNEDVSLSKDQYAENVLHSASGYEKVDVNHFIDIFNIIGLILQQSLK